MVTQGHVALAVHCCRVQLLLQVVTLSPQLVHLLLQLLTSGTAHSQLLGQLGHWGQSGQWSVQVVVKASSQTEWSDRAVRQSIQTEWSVSGQREWSVRAFTLSGEAEWSDEVVRWSGQKWWSASMVRQSGWTE